MKEKDLKKINNWKDIEQYNININPVEKELSNKVQTVIQVLKDLKEVQNDLNDFMKDNKICSYSVRAFFKTDNFSNFLEFARYKADYFPIYEVLLKEYPNKYHILIHTYFISDEVKQYLTFFMLNTLNDKKTVIRAIYDIPYYYTYDKKTIDIYNTYNFLYPIANLLYNDLHDEFFTKGRWSIGKMISLLGFFSDYATDEEINIILEKLPTIKLSNNNVEPFFNFVISNLRTKEQKERAKAVLLMKEFRS